MDRRLPVQQITNNAIDDIYPRINKADELVWQGFDVSEVSDGRSGDWEIFYFGDGSVRQITENESDDLIPRITDGGNIVWTGSEWGQAYQVKVAGKENYYEYSYTFTYSNGDKYFGTVRTTANQYYVGYKKSISSIEGGSLTGSYLITGMSYLGVQANAGQVKANGYWDWETATLYTPLKAYQSLTTSGLGKETDFIMFNTDLKYRFGFYNSVFYEADAQ